MKQYGIIGHPLGHTMSPTLHNWGFRQLGLEARYDAWPTTPDELPAFMERFRTEPIMGLSVTIPHKRSVMDFVDEATYRAKVVGAVNTLYWQDGRIIGENTDVIGVVEPLRSHAREITTGLVLGAGGAARAAVAALKELKAKNIYVINRTRFKAESLAHDFGVKVADWDDRQDVDADVIINSTPLGMSGSLEDGSPMDASMLKSSTIVYDLVYNPLQTKLLREAEAAGARTIQGLEMFVHQGLEQFRLWTGEQLDPTRARELLLNALKSALED